MKLQPLNQARHPGQREPLRTFAEIAQELGLSVAQLRGHFARSNTPTPAAEYVKRRGTQQVSWYKPSLVRAWWAGHLASLEVSRG